MNALDRKILYRAWFNMIYRCTQPSSDSYNNYGGRGITVCPEWLNSFDTFVADMGERPKGHTLDRINVNGNYEPSNCKWSTRAEQARNTRKARVVTIEGKQYHVADLQDQSGINMRTIEFRAKNGLPLNLVLSKEHMYNNTESQKKATATHALLKKSQTHCKRGHELTASNVYMYRGRRCCRICRKATDRYLYYKKVNPIEFYLP